MVESGQKLVCKITSIFYSPWKILIEKNAVYTILSVDEGTITIILTDNQWYDFSFTKKKYKDYIWDFFYSPAEWRDKQIDSILND